MKLLFLDDNNERHKKFRQNAIGFSVLQAYTAREALEFMRKHDDLDAIFLDHDLNYETQNQLNDDEEDGRWVCRQMIEEGLHKNTQIIIHSMNAVGAEEMQLMLSEAGYDEVYQICSAWTMIRKNSSGGLSLNANGEISDDISDYR